MTNRQVAFLGGILLLGLTFLNSGFGRLTEAWLGSSDRSAEARAIEIERGYTIHADFILTVPAGGMSRSLENRAGRCLRWRLPDNETRSTPPAQAITDQRRYWHYRDPTTVAPFRRIRFDGHSLTHDLKIRVQERDAGQCDTWS